MAAEKRDILGDWAPLLAGDFSSAAVTQPDSVWIRPGVTHQTLKKLRLVRFACGEAGTPEVLCRGAHLDHVKTHPSAFGRECTSRRPARQ